MARELRDFRTLIFTKVSTMKEKLMEEEYIDGQMEKYMKESGTMDFNKVLGFGKEYKEIIMRVIGSNHKQMDMEFSNIQMETDIKVIGNNLTKVESELNFTIMDQFLKVTSIMTYLKEKAK